MNDYIQRCKEIKSRRDENSLILSQLKAKTFISRIKKGICNKKDLLRIPLICLHSEKTLNSN
jgi:hypothetical protein